MSRNTRFILSGVITGDVKEFLLEFRETIREGNVEVVWNSYQKFNQKTEETFRVSSWPQPSLIRKELNIDMKNVYDISFMILYKELYFRHLFERCQINYYDQKNSFKNYYSLFNKLLISINDDDDAFPLIPNKWLWDMINSFVSQFQYFQYWKTLESSKKVLRNKTKELREVCQCILCNILILYYILYILAHFEYIIYYNIHLLGMECEKGFRCFTCIG